MRKPIHPTEHKKRFANLLYLIFISEGAYDIPEIAHALGVSESSFYKYCQGGTEMPLKYLTTLYNVTEDPRILEYFTNQCGLAAFRIPEIATEDVFPVFEQSLKTQREFLSLMEETGKSLADGKIDRREFAQIAKKAASAHGAIAKLEACAEAACNRASILPLRSARRS